MILYFAAPRRMKNVILFLGSLVFYAWGEPVYVLLMLFSTVSDYVHGRLIDRYRGKNAARALLISSIIINLGVLGFFKYSDFLIGAVNQLFGSSIPLLGLPLPIGISFYTFQTMSYTIDCYRGEAKVQKNILDFGVYVTMFPQLIAGPIVKYRDVEEQLYLRKPDITAISYGCCRFITGLAKKVLLANNLGLLWTEISGGNPANLTVLGAWLGVVAYAFQIYFDFSGYSDMAIGIALIMGFKLAKNFDFPYKAQNLTDFWRRWHISLSTWLRDYIYIPLGGNRKGTVRTYLNNFATMLIGGLWHGAAWKFVFWGAMHGAGLAVHKASKPVLGRIGDSWPVRAASWLVTMTFVALLWVFFRADSWADSWTVVSSVFRDFSAAYIPAFAAARSLWLILMLVIVVSHCLPTRFWESAQAWFVRSPWIVKLLIFIVVVQLVIELRTESVSPFIYFQF